HLNLPYILAYDNFPLTTLQEKKEILPQAIEEDWIIIFEHDAFVKAGKIGFENGKYFVREQIEL
ncbi:MAG: MBL fold metallo-hydrolase, partial [Candidatus Kapaibacteriota bacterium]